MYHYSIRGVYLADGEVNPKIHVKTNRPNTNEFDISNILSFYFIAPVIPCAKFFCSIKKIIAVGNVHIRTAVINIP